MSAKAPRRWLLLRGLAREQRHWGEFRDHLAQATDAEEVLCLDLPGTGTECRRGSPCTIASIMEDVRDRFLREAGRDVQSGAWGIIALSMGGMVAMEWLSRYPEDFSAVVLINSSAGGLAPPWKRIRPSAVRGLLKTVAMDDPLLRERRILKLTTRLLADPESIAQRWADCARERPARLSAALSQLLAAALFRAPPALPCPVLVVSSAQDAFTHPRCSHELSVRLGASHQIHARGGHDLPLDDPAWLSTQVARWMTEAFSEAERD